MKQFTITKAALRVFSLQLQAKGDGFNLKQLRTLDKIVTIMDAIIGEYDKKIDDRIEQAKLDLVKDPKEVESINRQLNEDLDKITNFEDRERVDVNFEDEQYNFAKEIWDNMGGYKGNNVSRKLILEADDAINTVVDPAKKNDSEETKEDKNSQGTPGEGAAN